MDKLSYIILVRGKRQRSEYSHRVFPRQRGTPTGHHDALAHHTTSGGLLCLHLCSFVGVVLHMASSSELLPDWLQVKLSLYGVPTVAYRLRCPMDLELPGPFSVIHILLKTCISVRKFRPCLKRNSVSGVVGGR